MATAITAPEVVSWAGGGLDESEPNLGAVIAAVNSYVETLPIAADASADERVKLGAIMLAARTMRRRNSPNGIETITGDGVAFVARYDPEVSRFLGLDAPAVG